MAPATLRMRIEILSLNKNMRKIIIDRARIPPEKLKSPAIPPRVIKTKMDLRTTNKSAEGLLIENKLYMITMLPKPSLTPGGKPRRGVTVDSKREKTMIKASIMAVVVNLMV